MLDEFDLDLDALELLIETCRVMDTIDGLRETVARDGQMIPGSMGQTRLHPAVSELRQQQRQLVDFIGRLGIEPVDEAVTGVTLAAVPDPPTYAQQQAARRAELKKKSNSRRASNAAHARWR